jgi:hypothetical protein
VHQHQLPTINLAHARTPAATAQGIRLLHLQQLLYATAALRRYLPDRLFKPLLLLLLLLRAHLKNMSAFSTSSAVHGRIT